MRTCVQIFAQLSEIIIHAMYAGGVISEIIVRNHFPQLFDRLKFATFGAVQFLLCLTLVHFTLHYTQSPFTGCKSDIWKKVQVNILKEPLLVLKQTIHQQKALDLSFNMAP